MKMQDVRMIAKDMGVDARIGRSKRDIIRDIQVREGNSPCFRTEMQDQCGQTNCLWKADCMM